MPILCPISIRDITSDEFDSIDRIVMKHAYASQNELGRLRDELVYENDLALRLKNAGHQVETQVPINITYKGFEKIYRIDLVCDHAVYDGKTVTAFTGVHDAQVLNYALLLGIRHIKLLNFRTSKVQGRLRCNGVSNPDRYRVEFITHHWTPLTESCRKIRSLVEGFVCDWGGFLSAQLYQEALAHFFGGEQNCSQRIDLSRNGNKLGTHRVQFHAPNHFFIVTAITREIPAHYSHLQRLLRLTQSKCIQWINFNHHNIEFNTIT